MDAGTNATNATMRLRNRVVCYNLSVLPLLPLLLIFPLSSLESYTSKSCMHSCGFDSHSNHIVFLLPNFGVINFWLAIDLTSDNMSWRSIQTILFKLSSLFLFFDWIFQTETNKAFNKQIKLKNKKQKNYC